MAPRKPSKSLAPSTDDTESDHIPQEQTLQPNLGHVSGPSNRPHGKGPDASVNLTAPSDNHAPPDPLPPNVTHPPNPDDTIFEDEAAESDSSLNVQAEIPD